jgi:small-conductance mechanosensitive channel
MKYIKNKENNTSIPNSISLGKFSSSSKQELTDYLPLSIFLALFGTLIMLATKNLLENYFTGLALKIDPPYDEGERIRIDNGEMLAVESIGFRATTFYGIESNTQLVIPYQKLTQATITNYTQPTLDYRRKITIYIPDTNHNKSIPREAEKVLLLAAFISTGVKRPEISQREEKLIEDNIQQYIKNILKFKKEKKEKDLNIKYLNELEGEEKQTINNIWNNLIKEDRETTIEEIEKNRKNLFLNGIFKLIKDEESYKQQKDSKDLNIFILKKLVIAIYSVLYSYKSNKNLKYHIDEYLVKRKFKAFNNFKKQDIDNENIENKNELNKLADYLVNINYYYFALAKQLWQLKDKDDSVQKKKDFDHASLELLDVPRVTSTHKRDIEGAFWEVTLLVTVELGEQSDEIIQHINMYVDELWEIFDLPYRCRVEKNSK